MGIGKTSLVKIISTKFKLAPVYEQFAANPFLPKFYTDMKRWAYHSQTFFLLEKIKALRKVAKSNGKKTIIQDTPIYQDVYSYAKAQRILGHMSREEWKQYLELYEFFSGDLPEPELIIYLTCPVDKISERIAGRKRGYETGVEKKNLMNYLSILDKLNREWIKRGDFKAKVFEINTEYLDYANSKKHKTNLVKTLAGLLL